jgi:hypothetical protein
MPRHSLSGSNGRGPMKGLFLAAALVVAVLAGFVLCRALRSRHGSGIRIVAMSLSRPATHNFIDPIPRPFDRLVLHPLLSHARGLRALGFRV